MAGKISKGLGRGLDALLGDAAQAEPVTSLPVQKLEPNPLQPRKLFEEAELQDQRRGGVLRDGPNAENLPLLEQNVLNRDLVQPLAGLPENIR